MGIACGAKGLADEEIQAYKKVVELDAGNLDALYNLGHSYRQKGMYKEAIVSYKKVLEIDPNYIDAYFNLGVSYSKKVCWTRKSSNITRC